MLLWSSLAGKAHKALTRGECTLPFCQTAFKPESKGIWLIPFHNFSYILWRIIWRGKEKAKDKHIYNRHSALIYTNVNQVPVQRFPWVRQDFQLRNLWQFLPGNEVYLMLSLSLYFVLEVAWSLDCLPAGKLNCDFIYGICHWNSCKVPCPLLVSISWDSL